MPVAPGTLHDPLATRRQIVHDDRQIKTEVREIDDIEVGPIAGGNDSPVVQAVTAGRRRRLLVDQEFQRQLRAARPIARPKGAGRQASWSCKSIHVRTAVGDAADRVAVYEHLVDDA